MRNLPRADLAVAGVLAAYALVEGLLLSAPATWLLAGLAACAALAWRRRHPAAVVAFVLAVVFLPAAIGVEGVDSVLPLPLMIVAGYTAGHEASSDRAALLAAVAVVALAGLGQALDPGENTTVEDVVALLVLIGGCAPSRRPPAARSARCGGCSACCEPTVTRPASPRSPG